MEILGHFFAHMAADAARDAKKEKEKNKKWNATFTMLQQKETELQNYLNSVGCKLPYVFDVDVIDNGSVTTEVRKMESIKKNIQEYLALGGDIQVLLDFDHIERHIGVLRYLRKIGQVHRQYEFLDDTKYSVEDKIKAEEEALAQQIALFRAEQQAERHTRVTKMVGGNIDTLSGVDFERVCQQLVENMGFKTETTKASGDGGIDLIAHNYQPLLSGKYIIQCKRYSGSVGEPIIRDLYGVVMSERANKGILMTTGSFTRSAVAFAEGKPIELIDGVKIKELLLQYGLCSEDDGADSSDDSVVSIEFDPASFMGYYYDDYLAAKRCVDRDPGNIRSRCTLIETIQKTIQMRLYLFELGDKGAYVINPNDIQGMLQLLRDNLQAIIQFDNSQSPNKRLKTVYYISMLMDGEAAILSGDFISGTERYCKVLKEWDDLKDEDVTTINILYSLFGIFRLVGCTELVDKYYAKYASLIQQQKRLNADVDPLFSSIGEHKREQLEVLNNPYNVTQFIVMSASDFYDKCVDDWGGINVNNGFCRIDVNREKDWLFYCGRKKWKTKSQETVLIENFNSLAARQRDFVAYTARIYL